MERVGAEVISLLGCKEEDILKISAKNGTGVEAVLEAVVKRISPPTESASPAARALIFDSYYDDYRGVILYVRVFDGAVHKNAQIK